MDKVSTSRTKIVVAHRLSIIVNADKIVALDNGFIIEHGKHNELLEKDGVYSNLVNKQMIDTVKNSNDSLKPENHTDPEIHLQQERWYVRNQIEILKDEIDLKHPKTNTTVILEIEKNIIDFNDNIPSENINFNANTAYDFKLKTVKEEKDLLKKQNAPFKKVFMQMCPEWKFIVTSVIGAAIGGTVGPVFAFLLSKVITLLSLTDEDINPGPLQGVNLYAFLFLMFSIAFFVGYGGQTFF